MNARPKRVLHVLGAFNHGGVETWLLNVLRRLDPDRVRADFLVQTTEPGAFDAEIERRKARLLRCGVCWHSPAFAAEFVRLLRRFGPYDAVHSHVHHFSGYLLWLARRVSVPVRIAHSHTDTSGLEAESGWSRRRYLRLTRDWICAHASCLAAASREAGRALFGHDWEGDRRSRLLHCGIDLTAFASLPDRAAARRELGIAEHDLVIGHVGRFAAPKNHRFLAEIAARAAQLARNARLLLVGDGPLRPMLQQRLATLGISGLSIMPGARSDIPRMLAAMDVFVFPSLWEGLPLTVVEAQAAGLPCVISDVISPETDIVPGLVRRASLDSGADDWAKAAIQAARERSIRPAAALAALAGSDFNITKSVEKLYELYDA